MLVFGIMGCGTGNQSNSTDTTPAGTAATPSGTSAPDASKNVKLRMTWWGSQIRHDMTLKAIKLFEEKNPGITIDPEYSSYDTYFDKLSTQIAGGDAPDILQVDLAWMDSFTSTNVLLDLSPFVTDKTLQTDRVDRAGIDVSTYNQKLYAIPTGFMSLGVIYNSSVFAETGVPEPTPDWTWEDFAKKAADIAKAKGKDYFGTLDGSLMSPVAFNLEIFVRQQGRALFKDGQVGATREDLISWFKMWDDMRKTGASTSAEFTANSTWSIETRPITTGHAAMDFDVQNKLESYQKSMKNQNDVIKIAPFPHAKNEVKNGTNIRTGITMGAYAKTQNPKESVLFLDFFLNDPDAAMILGVDRGVPANKDNRELVKPGLSDLNKTGVEFVEYITGTSSPIDPPYPMGYAEVEKKLKTAGESIAYGQQSIEAATDQFIAEANTILKEARSK
jgi:multiple sugar transport system substrate-binding protein